MNNQYGFYIKKLILTGDDIEPAEITFEKGLNVVHGPSDTGKTFIFQCIQFLLGKSDIPKRIPESKKYITGYLEISTYQSEPYTLKRALSGRYTKVYALKYGTIDQKSEFDNKSKSELSVFLLELCNMANKKARKNKNGVTKKITFRILQNFFLLGETELQMEMSPIQKEQYTDKTYLDNVFKYLITEIDDGDAVIKVEKSTIDKKSSRLELLDELIVSAEEELSEYIDKSTKIDEQLQKLSESIETTKSKHIELKEIYNKHQKERTGVESSVISKKSRLNHLNELLKRANILEKQYLNDINRLKSTIEACESLEFLEKSNCPLCKNPIEEEIDSSSIIKASGIEIQKIEALHNELLETVEMFKGEQEELSKEIKNDEKIIADILDIMENDINQSMRKAQEDLTNFFNRQSQLKTAQILTSKLDKYLLDKSTINKFLERTKEDNQVEFEELNITMVASLMNKIKIILNAINFEQFHNVIFSEKLKDIVIDDKGRQEFGKGYRALLYSVFIIALTKVLEDKTFQIGVTVFDSPMVTYKPSADYTDNDLISVDLAKNLYNYIADNFHDSQVIIIENTAPPKNEAINVIEFTKNKKVGRYGFIPLL